jgi:oxygen-dependent protoporphyrinogen oxidase
MLGAAMRDLFSPSNLPNSVSDESVDSFLSRRFGSRFARDLGSALVHGIYAADSRELSVRAAFPSLWNAHSRGGGSVIRSMFTRSLQSRLTPEQEYVLGALPSFMKNVSAFSFRHGVSQLVETLKQRLLATENVEILHAPVAELRCTGRQFQVGLLPIGFMV